MSLTQFGTFLLTAPEGILTGLLSPFSLGRLSANSAAFSLSPSRPVSTYFATGGRNCQVESGTLAPAGYSRFALVRIAFSWVFSVSAKGPKGARAGPP